MSRLTTNKKASEMGMYELAHNGCYVGEDGSARYRDFSSDVDCREMIKKLMINFGVVESDYWDDVSNEVFDDEMMENLMYGINDMQGLIALFYRNMWAMADLREKLKYFEDLDEQGLLLKLPCKVGDKAYYVNKGHIDEVEIDSFVLNINLFVNVSYYIGCERFGKTLTPYKTLFFTKEEAEQALKRLEGAE